MAGLAHKGAAGKIRIERELAKEDQISCAIALFLSSCLLQVYGQGCHTALPTMHWTRTVGFDGNLAPLHLVTWATCDTSNLLENLCSCWHMHRSAKWT